MKSAIRGLLSSSSPLKEPEEHFFEMPHKIINPNPEVDRQLAKIRLTEVPAHYLVNLTVEQLLDERRSELRMLYRRIIEVPAA